MIIDSTPVLETKGLNALSGYMIDERINSFSKVLKNIYSQSYKKGI
jgi:hypothetical protein